MVMLVNPDLYFIERSAIGPLHIAAQPAYARWQTLCGRRWHRDQVSELTARESNNDDPDSYVCRRCVACAADASIRIEE